MKFQSPSEYLKSLHQMRYYLNKFRVNSCSTWLIKDISLCINALDTEIIYYQNFIKESIRKKQEKELRQLKLNYNNFNKVWEVI